VRDEPGIGAFLVALGPPEGGAGEPRTLTEADIERLRETKKIVTARARAILRREG